MWYWAVTRRGASVDNITEFLRKRENILLEFEEKRVSYFPSPHIGLAPSRVEKKKD